MFHVGQKKKSRSNIKIWMPGLGLKSWGPSAWNTLHCMAHAWSRTPTDAQRERMYSFLHMFAVHLPCPTCRTHFVEMLVEQMPGAHCGVLESRDTLVAFCNSLHNQVNRRLGKREFTLKEHYAVYHRRRGKFRGNGWHAAFALSLLAVVVVAVHRTRRRTARRCG